MTPDVRQRTDPPHNGTEIEVLHGFLSWHRATLLGKTHGLDAAVDLISDLEWFGNSRGYLVVVEGLDRAGGVIAVFASLLPNIVDRWRARQCHSLSRSVVVVIS